MTIQSIKVAHLNIRSLFAHLSEYRDTFNKNDFDFLALSETWLNEDTDNTIVALSGYNLFRSDRNGRGGGVAIYARKNTVCSIISVDTKGFDELWLTTNISGQKYAIGVIYKPPNYNVHQFASELEDSINIICQNFDNIILSGDFNIDVSKINKTSTILLNNLLESYDLIQLIDQPTRITATSQSIIDIIICSKNLILANHKSIRQTSKRAREEVSPPSEPLRRQSDTEGEQFSLLIRKMNSYVKDLVTTLRSTPNTKGEIKKSIRGVEQVAEQMSRRWKEMDKSSYVMKSFARGGTNHAPPLQAPSNAETQTEHNLLQNVEVSTREVAIQVDSIGGTRELEDEIDKAKSFDEVACLLDKDWPDELFQATKLVSGGFSRVKEQWDISLIVDPGDKGEGGVLKAARERYPCVSSLLNGKLEVGVIDSIKVATRMVTSKGEVLENCRHICLVPYAVDTTWVNDMQKLYTVLAQLKQTIGQEERKQVAIVTPDGLDTLYEF
nr:unnamed protein product [Callosobruchus analis]